MDYETVSAGDFGASLRGLGMNILVRDVAAQAEFLKAVFDMKAHRVSADFAIITYGEQVFQLHSDGTYHSHPLPSLLPEVGARGAGAEFRLYVSDPDAAVSKAIGVGAHILQEPTNKPHGLREAYILCENGYAWVPSRALTQEERDAQ
jgi:predicted enzyme related to lactoylglutathione lyase